MRWNLAAFYAGVGFVLAASALRAGEAEDTLRRANIQFTKNAAGQMISVELPPGARDFHIEAVVDNAPTVSEFKAVRCVASFRAMKELDRLPNLSRVNLEGAENANDYVVCLRGAKNLTSLCLARSGLTNHGLNDLCLIHPALHDLDLSFTRITTNGLSSIGKLKHLVSLRLASVHEDELTDNPTGAAAGLRYVASLPYLRRLTLQSVRIRKEDIDVLACNCRLEELLISIYNLDSDCDLSYLLKCNPDLRLGDALDPPELAVVMGSGHIEAITFSDYSKFMMLPVEQITRLRRLAINDAPNLSFLSTLRDVTELTLVRPALRASDVVHLKELSRLSALKITEARIDRDLADALSSLVGLEKLRLQSCQIDNEAELALRQKPRNNLEIVAY